MSLNMDVTRTEIIGLIILFLVCRTVSGLRCMNCTSDSSSPVAGCHDDFSEDFLVECPKHSTHCQVLRYEGSFYGVGIIEYERICATDFSEECVAVDSEEYDGVKCIFSCEEDGCNGMNIFPNEPEFNTISPSENDDTETDEEDFPGLKCYNCFSDPSENDGCEERMSANYLTPCKQYERFCTVSKIQSEFGVTYARSCSPEELDGCVDDVDGETCNYSCDTDGCNGINAFPHKEPADMEETVPTTLVAMVTKRVDSSTSSATIAIPNVVVLMLSLLLFLKLVMEADF